MDINARLEAVCERLPGAVKSDPWGGGHDAWKVGDKMFASIGMIADGVSVKCDNIESAEMLIDAGVGIKAPYFHKSWIKLPVSVSDDDLQHRVVASYDKIRGSLTKKKQAEMPQRPKMEG
jgi:predicted DNA-binding protein (MmcQ/YjbR family)